MRSSETEGVAVAFALHAICTACGEFFEIVEVARDLCEPLAQLLKALGLAELRAALAAYIDERQAQHLAGAFVHQQVKVLLCGDDVAFEDGAVFGVFLEAGDNVGVGEPAGDLLEIRAHDFSRPRDEVEREEDAQENDEQPAHGDEYKVGSGGGGFWEDVSYSWRA